MKNYNAIIIHRATFDLINHYKTTHTKNGTIRYLQWGGAKKDLAIDRWYAEMDKIALARFSFKAEPQNIGGNFGKSLEAIFKDKITHTKQGSHTAAASGKIDFKSRKFGFCEVKSLTRGGSQSKIVVNKIHEENDTIILIREV